MPGLVNLSLCPLKLLPPSQPFLSNSFLITFGSISVAFSFHSCALATQATSSVL